MPELDIKIGDYWRDSVGNVSEIVERKNNSYWPWKATMLIILPEYEYYLGTKESFTKEGIQSSDQNPSKFDLKEKVKKEEHPEYFL